MCLTGSCVIKLVPVSLVNAVKWKSGLKVRRDSDQMFLVTQGSDILYFMLHLIRGQRLIISLVGKLKAVSDGSLQCEEVIVPYSNRNRY